ncbi:MAG: long-chain fatty acid--CoA ligase [Chloroflexi bacterium]|nr:long-chain fatty acid--CoA ligase [Chloroflexota bacterium]
MNGLMMDFPVTLDVILRRAETIFPTREIVTRLPDRSIHRYSYADLARRARRLAVALEGAGIRPGMRVATMCWNHSQHLEAYFGIPLAGAVLHTLNPRLGADDLTYIIENAGDSMLFVDESLLPVYEKIRDRVRFGREVIVTSAAKTASGMRTYDDLLASADPSAYVQRRIDENDAAAMCYSSGTTGRPKGVVYSHRAMVLHSMGEAMVDSLALCEGDVLLPVVPMFHVNAWGLAHSAALVGAKLVLPGPFLDPESLLDLYEKERVTITAGVPTVWLAILAALEKEPTRWHLVPGMRMVVGGAACPPSLLPGFDKHGLRVIHAWGMTETTPLGSVGNVRKELRDLPEPMAYAVREKQGMPAAMVEVRARGETGLIAWDGKAMGELEIRGPWIARAYYNTPDGADRFTEDGWFKTGDIVSIDPSGYITITDRSKDLVKSGGEWISTVALEGALMGHRAVAEAAVIAVPHPKWQERPLAVVVLKPGASASEAELIGFLAPKFAKWQLPDAVEFIDAIPRTATGKFLKTALRERFRDYSFPAKA